MEDMLCGGGHYECEKCGETVFGSAIHYCEVRREKPTKDKVILTEEQAIEILEQATIIRVKGSMETWINNLKFAGYIRKSPVEDAEEMYSRHVEYKGCLSSDEQNSTIDKLYEAIQYLKAENERLKK